MVVAGWLVAGGGWFTNLEKGEKLLEVGEGDVVHHRPSLLLPAVHVRHPVMLEPSSRLNAMNAMNE
jgi:hypothetical protein